MPGVTEYKSKCEFSDDKPELSVRNFFAHKDLLGAGCSLVAEGFNTDMGLGLVPSTTKY